MQPQDFSTLVQTAFANHYTQIKGSSIPAFNIQFYPYCGLNHSIRLRKGKIWIRISDILADAPFNVLSSLLNILLHKLFNTHTHPNHLRIYRHYINQPHLRPKILMARRYRSKKYSNNPIGIFFNLDQIFQQLNGCYFQEKLQVRMSWNHKKSRTFLACYDPAHQTIVVNRKLDDSLIPKWVLEYIVFHEMLHVSLGGYSSNSRWIVHHNRFHEAEKQFPCYRKARKFIATYPWR